MKIAVHCSGDQIAGCFGETAEFVLFEVEHGAIRQMTHPTPAGTDDVALADMLVRCEADLLLCGTLSAGAERALMDAGILFLRGCSGVPRIAVERYLAGTLPMGN